MLKMNEIVKIHNDLSNPKLNKLSAKELDLLMAICVKVKNQQDNVINIDFIDLQKLSNYKHYNHKDLENDLIKMNEHLIKNFVITYKDTDEAKVTESLFRQFRLYANNLKVQISDKLLYLLNDLTSNFTTFELKEFVSLKSKYSKRLYKLLKQFRSTGKYTVNKEPLYIELDVPKSYTNTNFNKRVLNVSLEECNKYFKNLNCVPVKSGRGGAVQGYTFTFTPNQIAKIKADTKSKSKAKSNKFNDFENKQNYDIETLEKQLLSN